MPNKEKPRHQNERINELEKTNLLLLDAVINLNKRVQEIELSQDLRQDSDQEHLREDRN